MLEVTLTSFEAEEEDAIDLGGPRREFLHLLLGAICKGSKTLTILVCFQEISILIKIWKEKVGGGGGGESVSKAKYFRGKLKAKLKLSKNKNRYGYFLEQTKTVNLHFTPVYYQTSG